MIMRVLYLVLGLFTLAGLEAQTEEALDPFILAWQGQATVSDKVDEVKSKLKKQNLEIVGEYSPYEDAQVIVVTSDALKQAAAKSEKGGFGAVQRVSVTKADSEVQVAYTNPIYMANAYRMEDDLSGVATKLEAALGKTEPFGSGKGLTAEDLRDYHYMFGMPYFDDLDKLATYDSHEQAVQAVEKALSAGKGGTSKVYQVALPNGEETLFGVKLTRGCGGDKHIMDKIDFASPKHTAHLPYEILVSGKDIYALNAKFRIAINFPDLGMMGDHSFASIMCAPGEIKEALTLSAGSTSSNE